MLTLFYCLALGLGFLYVLMLIFNTQWAFKIPDDTWKNHRSWSKEAALFYAAAVLGLVVNGFILLPLIDNFSVRLAVCIGGMLTAVLSLVLDARRWDWWGIALDLGILLSLGLVLYL